MAISVLYHGPVSTLTKLACWLTKLAVLLLDQNFIFNDLAALIVRHLPLNLDIIVFDLSRYWKSLQRYRCSNE